jgi:hypothetical protein
VNARSLAKPCRRVRIDPAGDQQHVVGPVANALSQQAVVMGDAVAEALQQTHPLREVLAHDRPVRKRIAELVTPWLLVVVAEETRPEAERHPSDDPSAGDALALLQTLYGHNYLLDSLGLEYIESISQVSLIGCCGCPSPRTPSIALPDEHLEMVHHPEARRRDLRVPVIKLDRPLVVAVAGDEERLEASRRQPCLRLVLLHDRASLLSNAPVPPRTPARELCGRGFALLGPRSRSAVYVLAALGLFDRLSDTELLHQIPTVLTTSVDTSGSRFPPLAKRSRVRHRVGVVSQPIGLGKRPIKVRIATETAKGV